MCGRFAMPWDPDELADRLGVNTNEDARSVAPSYNIAPDATIAVIRRTADGGSLLAGARWNLIPAWSDTDRLPYPTFNARVESAADKPTFRDARASWADPDPYARLLRMGRAPDAILVPRPGQPDPARRRTALHMARHADVLDPDQAGGGPVRRNS